MTATRAPVIPHRAHRPFGLARRDAPPAISPRCAVVAGLLATALWAAIVAAVAALA